MSLINQVLRDLDKRHASVNDLSAMPNEVRPLPEAGARRPAWLRLGLGVLLIVVATAGWYYWQEMTPIPAPTVAMTPPPAAVTSTVVVETPAVESQQTDTPHDAVPPAQTSDAPEMTYDSSKESVRLRLDLEISLPRPEPALPTAPIVERKPAPVTVPSKPEGTTPVPPLPPSNMRTNSPSGPAQVAQASAQINSKTNSSGSVASPASGPSGASTQASDDWVRAQNYLRGGNNAEAEPLLRNLLDTQPALQAPRQALIGVLLGERRFAEAIPVLKQGLVHHPDQTSWAMNLARLHADKGDYASAWEALSVSLARAQQQPDYLAFAGTVLQRLDRSTEAVAQYQAALRQRPEEARWWVGLGIALEGAQRPGEARAAYQQARSIGGFSPEMARFVEQKLQ